MFKRITNFILFFKQAANSAFHATRGAPNLIQRRYFALVNAAEPSVRVRIEFPFDAAPFFLLREEPVHRRVKVS